MYEDIDYRHPRGLDKSQMKSLSALKWVKDHFNILITGPSGAGKSFIACALGHRVCMKGYRVLYFRASRLFNDLGVVRGDGRYCKLINAIAKNSFTGH